MKWVVGVITSLLLIGCFSVLGIEMFRYYTITEEINENELKKVEVKMQELESEIKEKDKERQALEENKASNIEVYKLWEKEVQKLS